jgi:signal transduction histidine kinase
VKAWLRLGLVLAGCLCIGLLASFLLLANWLGAPPSHTASALRYLLYSGVISLAAGVAAVMLAVRFIPSLGVKIAIACLFGSVAAIINVVVTPLLMFSERSDKYILVITLIYFLIISLAFAGIVGVITSGQLHALRDGARQIGRGEFGHRVEVQGSDEVADLARAFNRMSMELGEAFEMQRRMEEERRDMMASISHDLRTPLSAIRAMIEAINDGVVHDQAQVTSYLHAIQQDAEHLGRLIDDLFELSRIESGSLELRLASVPLAQLVRETVDGLSVRAGERGVHLDAVCESSLPPVSIDAPRMRRVLVNLIDNALRHTPPGGRVEVAVTQDEGGVRLAVADTGEGIALKDQSHVFDRFYRSEKSRSREKGGAGLGLAIARGIVEAHHGTISVESNPGKGARFVVSL